MNPLQYRAGKVPGIERRGVLGRLLDWWYYPIDDAYLAGAADLADLERRWSIVERGRPGPFYVTFNH